MKAKTSVKLAMSFTSRSRMRKAFLDRAASTTVANRESRVMRAPEQANDTGFQRGWHRELERATPRDPLAVRREGDPGGQWKPGLGPFRAGPRVRLFFRSTRGMNGGQELLAPGRGLRGAPPPLRRPIRRDVPLGASGAVPAADRCPLWG